jgi:hypothetical protein
MSPSKQQQPIVLARAKGVLALTKSMQCEKKGDELVKLGRHELAQREYQTSLRFAELCFGRDHVLVSELRNKFELDQSVGWRETAQRETMKELSQSLQHELRGDYLEKAGRPAAAAREYQLSLSIEKRIIGASHPLVGALEAKYNATQAPTPVIDKKPPTKHCIQPSPRGDGVTALTKSIQCEKKGDELIKLGHPECAQREYEAGLKYSLLCFGREHHLVSEFRNKVESDQCGWQRTAQRKTMQELSQSLKHEKHGDYLVKVGRPQLAAREYQLSLAIEKRIIGAGHPLVGALEEKYDAITLPADDAPIRIGDAPGVMVGAGGSVAITSVTSFSETETTIVGTGGSAATVSEGAPVMGASTARVAKEMQHISKEVAVRRPLLSKLTGPPSSAGRNTLASMAA